MERKRYAVHFKAVEGEANTFEGHASIFNVPDDGRPPDIVLPGAFAKTIQEWGPEGKNRIKILALHRYDWLPIGRPTVLKEDEKGLFFRAQLSDTVLGRDIKTLIADGVISELSIGYDPVKWEIDKTAGMRRLSEVRLWEISPVTWAMHPQALIDNVKDLMTQLNNPCCTEGLCQDRRAAAITSLQALLEHPEPSAEATQADTPDPAAALFTLDPEQIQSMRALVEDLTTFAGRH